jgi:hypothetical protein
LWQKSKQNSTAGDFVVINYISNVDSQILATLPRRTCFSIYESAGN